MNRRDLFQRALAFLGLGAIVKAKPADPLNRVGCLHGPGVMCLNCPVTYTSHVVQYSPHAEADFERYMRIKREMERSALAYERKLVDEYLRSDDPPPIVR